MKWWIVILHALSIGWVTCADTCGIVFGKQMFDHSALVAPLNAFMHALSGVPLRPFLPLERWPDLRALQATGE